MEYFSTYLTGFGNLISRQLKKQIPDTRIRVLLDGLILYQTGKTPEEVFKQPFFNNNFILLNFFKVKKNTLIEKNIEELVNKIKIPAEIDKNQSFDIVYSRQNQTEKMSGKLFDKLREGIGKKTHWAYSPQAKIEFWIMERSEGFVFLGLRVKGDTKPYLEKGQLRSELAYLLILLSEPNEDDIFLDPFAGSGALAFERLKFPFQKILAGDNDPGISQKLKGQSLKLRLPITVGRWDAVKMAGFNEGDINKIVTDPPWGVHLAKHLDLQQFYSKMLKEFHRVLKPNGIVVILISNKELLEKLLRELNLFKLEEKYSTLVNGQKAGVYKLQKV